MDNELEAGIDYYTDDSGLLVFTEACHLKRGYCCASGCRHCPWKKLPKADNSQENEIKEERI
jgi:hypothetical protein